MMKATQPARRKVQKMMVAMSFSMESTGVSTRGTRPGFSCRDDTGGGRGLLSSIPLSFTFWNKHNMLWYGNKHKYKQRVLAI